MGADNLVLKDTIKNMDKDFVQLNKQIKQFQATLSRLHKDFEATQQIKAHAKISKTYMTEVRTIVNKTSILESIATINKTIESLSTESDELKIKTKDINNFLEKFRNIRIYQLSDKSKIFRFLSGFLDGLSEFY